MKIIAISDTHVRKGIEDIPSELIELFEKSDMVLHSGDFVSLKFYEELSAVCNLNAVAGNMDPPEISSILPRRLIIDVDGVKIGLTHGWGTPKETPINVAREFADDDVDVIVFGHTHSPLCEKRGDVLLFNPGSLLDKRFSPKNSYGVIQINKGTIKKAEIVEI